MSPESPRWLLFAPLRSRQSAVPGLSPLVAKAFWLVRCFGSSYFGLRSDEVLKRTGKRAVGTQHSVQTSEVEEAFNLIVRVRI
jgi:hypothetical protein